VCAPDVLVACDGSDVAAATVIAHSLEAGVERQHVAPVTSLTAAAAAAAAATDGRVDSATAVSGKEAPLRDSDPPGQRQARGCMEHKRVVLCKGLLPLRLDALAC